MTAEMSQARKNQCVRDALGLLRSWVGFNGEWEMVQCRKLLAAAIGQKNYRGMSGKQAEKFKQKFYAVRGKRCD